MSGGEQESSSQQYDIQAREYQALRPIIADIFQRGGGAFDPGYQGPFTAQMSPEEQRIMGQIGGYQPRGFTPGQAAANEARLATIRGQNLTPTEQFAPWARAINEAFREGTLENVGQFTAAGHNVQESSPFARAEAISDRARADALARVASDIYQTERGYQEEAARYEETVPGQRAAVSAQDVQTLMDQLQAVALPRLIEEMGIERGMEEYARRMEIMLNFLGLGVQTTQPVVGTESESAGYNFVI
jgi:hypothetical protein